MAIEKLKINCMAQK